MAEKRRTGTGRQPVVLVVGGGFAGLDAVKGLADAPVSVILADRHNYHLFQPLLYQVATAVLSPADIASPIRHILSEQENVEVILDELVAVDLGRCRARFLRTEVAYDFLVLAMGVTHAYFGHDEWEEIAPGLKTVDDALEMRRRVLLAFEEAEQEEDPDSRRAKLTFVVVGGGPTGVELAGALKEIAARSVPHDFRHIDTATARILLVEAQDRLLSAFPDRLGRRALEDLRKMGVEVWLGARVTDVKPDAVRLGDEWLETENVFWAAGIRAPAVAGRLGVPLDDSGRIRVGPDLSLPGHPEAFVIGDLAHVEDPDTGEAVPGLAPAAKQMGSYVAGLIRGGTAPARSPFRYRDKGMMATIGRFRAVASLGRWHFTGSFAWFLWCFIHIYFLVGFRRRLFVMLAWIWNYAAFHKGARLITGHPVVQVKSPRQNPKPDQELEEKG